MLEMLSKMNVFLKVCGIFSLAAPLETRNIPGPESHVYGSTQQFTIRFFQRQAENNV